MINITTDSQTVDFDYRLGKPHSEVKEELLRNPEVRKEYERFDLSWELQKAWVRFRIWLTNTLKD